jgi:hypothetical protein
VAADAANAQRRSACPVFFDETALSLTPNVRRTWAPRGRPPTLTTRSMRAWLNRQRSWLVVERLGADAPELNPVEGLWSSLTAVELANLTLPTLAEVID